MIPALTAFRTATSLSDKPERIKAIEGMIQTQAETGHFAASFSRAEYQPEDFHHLAAYGYAILSDAAHIYVEWHDPKVP